MDGNELHFQIAALTGQLRELRRKVNVEVHRSPNMDAARALDALVIEAAVFGAETDWAGRSDLDKLIERRRKSVRKALGYTYP